MSNSQEYQSLDARLAGIEHLIQQVYEKLEVKPPVEKTLTVPEAAKFVHKSIPTVYTLVSKGLIPCCKQGKHLYFKISDLDKWLEEGRRKTRKEMLAEAAEQMRRNGRLNNKSNRHE